MVVASVVAGVVVDASIVGSEGWVVAVVVDPALIPNGESPQAGWPRRSGVLGTGLPARRPEATIRALQAHPGEIGVEIVAPGADIHAMDLEWEFGTL